MSLHRMDYSVVGRRLWSRITSMVREEEAVTAIEYALLAALIVSVIVTGVGMTGSATAALWEGVAEAVQQLMP